MIFDLYRVQNMTMVKMDLTATMRMNLNHVIIEMVEVRHGSKDFMGILEKFSKMIVLYRNSILIKLK